MRLLLIEDDGISRELWTMILEHEGHEVEATGSGEAAVEMLQRARSENLEMPDVVLTDLQLPGLCGGTLAAALREVIRQRGEQRRSTLLAMSASEPRRTALKGFDGFLLKPLTMEALREAIVRAERRVNDGVLYPILRETLNGQVLDEVVFERLLDAMPVAKVKELYELCLSDTLARLERMRVAAETQQSELYRRSAHEIQGACGMIGAMELRGLAAAMEETGLEIGTVEVTGNLNRFTSAWERLEDMLSRRWIGLYPKE